MLNFVFNFQPYNDLLLNLAGNHNQKGFFDNQAAQSKVFHAALTAQNISSSLCDSIYSIRPLNFSRKRHSRAPEA